MSHTTPVAIVTGASQSIGKAAEVEAVFASMKQQVLRGGRIINNGSIDEHGGVLGDQACRRARVVGMRSNRYFHLLLWSVLLHGTATMAQDTLPAGADQETVSAEAAEEQLMAELRGVVTSWASAWQSQFDDVYLMHYHPDFKPEDFASRQDWVAQRRTRIRDPGDINISLRDFSMVTHDADTALVRFWLHYSRPGYADDTHKEMLLEKMGQIWQIKRERNITVTKLAAP